jgi:outer membrane protein assembly factor BamB
VIGRIQTLLGFAGIVALGVTATLVTGFNPLEYSDEALDGIAENLNRFQGRLSDPPPRWSDRVDGRALAARMAGGNVIVVLHGAVEARRGSDGGQAWSRTVDWAVPVDDVVVAGRAEGSGFEVLEPFSGTVSWSDTHAKEVWPYSDLVLSTSCGRTGCVLRARASGDGRARWRTALDGTADRLSGYLDLDDAVDRTGLLHPDHPGPAPRLVGVVSDRRVTVVDTRSGSVGGRFRHDARTWVTVAGDRVLTSAAQPVGSSGCRYTIRGWDGSGRVLWRRTGYDPGTVSGSGCEQRTDPLVLGGVLCVVTADGRPVLIRVRDGDVRWRGRPGDTLLDTDGRIAVVKIRRSGELTAVDLRTGRALWSRTAKRPRVAVTGAAVLVTEPEAGTITALSPVSGGELATWRTFASVVGLDRAGVVFGNGRTVGYASW